MENDWNDSFLVISSCEFFFFFRILSSFSLSVFSHGLESSSIGNENQ